MSGMCVHFLCAIYCFEDNDCLMIANYTHFYDILSTQPALFTYLVKIAFTWNSEDCSVQLNASCFLLSLHAC